MANDGINAEIQRAKKLIL